MEKKIEYKPVTQIVGQPSKCDVTLLTNELRKMATSVKTKLGAGKHGHLRLVIEETLYKDISHKGNTFDFLAHPGAYPSNVSTDAQIRKKKFLRNTKLVELAFTNARHAKPSRIF